MASGQMSALDKQTNGLCVGHLDVCKLCGITQTLKYLALSLLTGMDLDMSGRSHSGLVTTRELRIMFAVVWSVLKGMLPLVQ